MGYTLKISRTIRALCFLHQTVTWALLDLLSGCRCWWALQWWGRNKFGGPFVCLLSRAVQL
jgi:hypothetical protein